MYRDSVVLGHRQESGVRPTALVLWGLREDIQLLRDTERQKGPATVKQSKPATPDQPVTGDVSALPSPANGHTDFQREVRRAGSHAVKDVERTQAIRLYCEMHGESWNLQVRGPEWINGGWKEGKAFMVATAHLSKEDLLTLRRAIDTLLAESEES